MAEESLEEVKTPVEICILISYYSVILWLNETSEARVALAGRNDGRAAGSLAQRLKSRPLHAVVLDLRPVVTSHGEVTLCTETM